MLEQNKLLSFIKSAQWVDVAVRTAAQTVAHEKTRAST